MPLAAGQTLSFYEILAPLGAGAMGEVWRARDTRLGREVAIKVLPEHFADDEERLRRFDREAKSLASLNHPNVAQVFGIDQVGDTCFIVMELVPGETLEDRIARGPLALDEAVELCCQVAEGLAAAHEAGVIHRDLKPANVRVTPEGKVKVLDFGLAKASGPDTGAGSTTDSVLATEEGRVLGTPTYMAPEQARGRAIDRRVDVWAFGCVLFECLTGTRAFGGDTLSDVLVAVLERQVDWNALPATTPASVRRVLQRCLAKDPGSRLRSLGDARLELLEPLETERLAGAVGPARNARAALAGWGVAAALLVAWSATRLLGAPDAAGRAPAVAPLHSELVLPADAPIAFGAGSLGVDAPLLALSPDGRVLVYVGRDPGGGSRLYRRDLTRFDPAEPVPGTEGAFGAAFSPDGRALAFLTFGRVERIALDGGSRVTLGAASSVVKMQWASDGWIYLGANQARTLQRVPESGGEVETVVRMPQGTQLSQVLPGAASALIVEDTSISADFAEIQLLDLGTGTVRTIVENGFDARLAPSGQLVFARSGSLLGVPFDAGRGTIEGEPVTLARDVVMDTAIGNAQYTLSASGSLAFVPGSELARGGIAWLDRNGDQGFLPVEEAAYGSLDLDSTDRSIAIEVGDVSDYVRVVDVATGRVTRMPGSPARGPIWSASGDWLAYTLDGTTTLHLESFDPAVPSRSFEMGVPAQFSGCSPGDELLAGLRVENDARRLGFFDVRDGAWGEGLEGDLSWCGAFSPDGKWLAYISHATGEFEAHVRSFPDGNVDRQVSDGGAIEVIWCPSGELIYRTGDRWMSVPIRTEPRLDWDAPRLAFETDFVDTLGRSFDVSSDGQRLYVVKNLTPPDGSHIRLVSSLGER